jgi:hypothetical protein
MTDLVLYLLVFLLSFVLGFCGFFIVMEAVEKWKNSRR